MDLKLYLLFLFVFFSYFSALCQDEPQIRVNGRYNNVTLKNFIKETEEKHPVRVFYAEEMVNDIVVNDVFENELLFNVLQKILAPTDLSVISFRPDQLVLIIDKDKAVKKVTEAEDIPGTTTTSLLLNGYVSDANSGDKILGATVFVEELKKGTSTNHSGFFSLNLPAGNYTLTINSVGYLSEIRNVALRNKQTLNIELYEKSIELKEVTITENMPDQNVAGTQMGRNTLNIKTLKSIPPFLGEVDIFRSLILLPGVSTVGEGAAGFNVRGGSVDQNLILLDEAPIFNPSHLFGFFSAFSSEVIKDATLYRGGIPGRFGGRISSVLDVRLKDGNKSKFVGSGGLGLVSSRIALEGPLVKEKTSFIVSGRASYSDWILRNLRDRDLRNSSAGFYDANVKIHHKLNERNSISLSGYLSHDSFSFASDTLYSWGNRSATLQWGHSFNDRLFGNFTALYSDYSYNVHGEKPETAFVLGSGLNYQAVKADFMYSPDDKNRIDFGLISSSYTFKPASLSPDSDESRIAPFTINNEKSMENGIYLNNEYLFSPKLSIQFGARYSLFYNLGPGNIFNYEEGVPRNITTIRDTANFSNNDIIKKYHGLEPRISVKWGISSNSSIKAGFNRMRQYVHLISNTTAITPIDLWQSSNSNISPMTGDQVSLGFFKNFMENTIEASAEIYYKKISNLVEYKDGAELLLNRNIETELLQGKGRAYGLELMARKTIGKVTGWASYTYSRSERLVDGVYPEEKINNGRYFPSNFDKPHDLTLVSNIDFTKRLSFSANFTYSTGRPITYPTSQFIVDGLLVVKYSDRNQYRIPDYHRLDISFTLEGNHRRKKKWHGSYNFSIYNLYSRRNAYSVFFKAHGRSPQLFRLAVLGSAFPSISYDFKF